jgi:hypothetical protein
MERQVQLPQEASEIMDNGINRALIPNKKKVV